MNTTTSKKFDGYEGYLWRIWAENEDAKIYAEAVFDANQREVIEEKRFGFFGYDEYPTYNGQVLGYEDDDWLIITETEEPPSLPENWSCELVKGEFETGDKIGTDTTIDFLVISNDKYGYTKVVRL